MENPTVTELRSRSRSKTPFLRSSCDGENCTETGEDHVHHKSGRKTHRSTPTKQLHRHTPEPLIEVDEEPAHRTRQAARMTSEKLVKTSDYSSEESLDRLRGVRKDLEQNFNSVYEECRVSTSTQRYKTLADLPFGSIRSPYHVNKDWSGSVCSTDSTFAEQALADASLLLERDPSPEHLPYKLYKMAGEYWNKYPKTDYTYSYLSKDRVELSPGQVAVPNMSRRSLSAFRVHGPNVSADELDELDRLAADMSWTSNATRKRSTYSSERADQRWWITRLLMTIITTITTTTSSAYRSVVGPSHRYPYTDRRPSQAGVVSRTASAVAAPFYWIYSVIKTMVTTTVTTVTETVTPNHVSKSESYEARSYHQTAAKRRWWPWLLLLLLPVLGYGSHYTYENLDHLSVPNFTDFRLDLSEFLATFPNVTLPSLPNISLSELNILPNLNLSLPEINITLPDLSGNFELTKKYTDVVQNRVADASDYMKVVAESCVEEMRRFWRGVIG